MSNTDVRDYAKAHGIQLWKLADVLGISEATLTRKLRYELSTDEKKHLFDIIDSLS